jgi:hypothetical protein
MIQGRPAGGMEGRFMSKQRSSRSPLGKVVLALACLGVLAIGAHMLIKPESYNFQKLGSAGPQQGTFQRGVTWLDSHVGTRPAGGLMAGVGLLGLIVSARPKKKEK